MKVHPYYLSKVSLVPLFLAIVASALPTTTSMLPHPSPFFFTESKGQWDARVLFKCQAKNGMTWFLERDGITLLLMQQGDRNSDFGAPENMRGRDIPVADFDDPLERDLPEMLRRQSACKNVPRKSHALKFHFVKGEGSKVNGERSTKIVSENLDQSFSTQHPTPYTLHRASAQSVEANGEMPWKNNYFLGNDSTKWAPNCRNFSSVIYRDVWDGIDIEWYENDGKLEFDFIVHPGFDPSQIRMSVEGLDDDLSLRGSAATKQSHLGNGEQAIGNGGNVRALLRDARTTGGISCKDSTDKSVCRTDSGRTPNSESRSPIAHSPLPIAELRLQTSLGELRTALPSVYQVSANGSRSEIDAAFQLTDQNTFGIVLPNGYNPDHSLRIDPLIYSTYLGGSYIDGVAGITNGQNGSIIIAGLTLSIDYPITVGALEPTYNDGDCLISDINSDGSSLLYSTYLGGTNGDEACAISGDGVGGVIITGSTGSTDYPVTNGSGHNGGFADCIITRLNSTGNQLIYSTYIGGSSNDYGQSIVNDGTGGCYITGYTGSANFPTTTNAFDRSQNGNNDCFVSHINNNAMQLISSTYIGGSGSDFGASLIHRNESGILITGKTSSPNFPVTANAYDTTLNIGTDDAFIAQLNDSLSRLISCSLLGGSGYDFPRALVETENGDIVMIGLTGSSDFPTTEGAFDTTFGGGTISSSLYDCFISQLSSDCSQLFYSTYLGDTLIDFGMDIKRYGENGFIVVGLTASNSFPVTIDAFDPTYNGGSYDCFLSFFQLSPFRLRYSTFLGGSNNDGALSFTINEGSQVTLGGYSDSPDFPITAGSYDTTLNGVWQDCFIARIQFDSTGVITATNALPTQHTLVNAFPNPFNPTTTIQYSVPLVSDVNLEVFDVLGRKVQTLVNQQHQPGVYQVRFDGSELPSGEYFCRMQAGEFVKTQKIVLLK